MVVRIVVVGVVDSPDSISTNETLVPSEQLGNGAAESLICSVGKMRSNCSDYGKAKPLDLCFTVLKLVTDVSMIYVKPMFDDAFDVCRDQRLD